MPNVMDDMVAEEHTFRQASTHENFVQIPEWMLSRRDVPPAAILLWGLIEWRAMTQGACSARNKHLAETAGVSVPSLMRLIAALTKRGWIAVEHTETDTRRITPLDPRTGENYKRTAIKNDSPAIKNDSPAIENESGGLSKMIDIIEREPNRELKTQFNTPDAPTARAGGDDDAAVTIFSEAYRNKYEGDKPHMTAATKRAMKECLNDIGEAQYRECVAGYFASEDEWAAGHGHDAKSFMMSPDRWRNNTAAPRKGNSAAPKHPGVGPVGGPVKRTWRGRLRRGPWRGMQRKARVLYLLRSKSRII